MIFDPWLYIAFYSFIFETRPQWQLQCVVLKCSVNCCCSVAKWCLTLPLKLHGLQHVSLPCPSSSPRVCSNSYPLVGDAIQPSHPLSSPSLSAFNLSQHQGLFLWVSFSHEMAKVFSFSILPTNIQGWFLLGLTGLIYLLSKGLFRDSQKSSPAPRFKSINSLVLGLLPGPTPTSIHGYWKNHSCDYTQLCWQSDVSAF